MAKRPRIRITVTDRLGPKGCHRGHKPGDTFDFDTQRGEICPMAMHIAFPYIDILRYGGAIPGHPEGTAVFCCSDVDTINVFKIERVEEEEKKKLEADEYDQVARQVAAEMLMRGLPISSIQLATKLPYEVVKELQDQYSGIFGGDSDEVEQEGPPAW